MALITHPEYSFVRVNEDNATIPSCSDGLDPCLPVIEMSDLQFQLLTDLPPVDNGDFEPQTVPWLIALPCQDGCAFDPEDLFNEIFGGVNYKIDVLAPSDSTHIGAVNISEDMVGIDVGDRVYLYNGNLFASGFYTVLSKAPFDGIGTTLVMEPNGDVVSNISNDSPYARVFVVDDSFPAFVSTSAFELPESSDYETAYSFGRASSNGVLPYSVGDCFSLCIYHLEIEVKEDDEPTFVSGECIGLSNCFRVPQKTCYTSKLRYSNNENGFDFYVATDVDDNFGSTIRLPMHLHSPQFPGEEKGYQKSDGTFLKLSERINKTWQLETDYMPDEFHTRLRVALSCDNIQITNENVNLVDEDIYRSEPYELADTSSVDSQHKFPFWKATTTVFKKMLSKSLNANCNA